MWQLQSHHVALDHSRKEVTETPEWHEDSSDSEAIVWQGDRLTWLKPRSTTVPAHRTWDWGPAVFMSCRFCSRIFKKQNNNLCHCFRRYQSQRGTVEIPYSSFPGLPLDWCSLEWTGWQLPPGERRHPLTTVKSTSTKVKHIYWLARKTKKKNILLKVCRLHETKIKNHAELKKKKLKCPS